MAEGGEADESQNLNSEAVSDREPGSAVQEKEKDSPPKTVTFNANQLLFPPPEALIQKSAIAVEPAKTGAPIAFVKL